MESPWIQRLRSVARKQKDSFVGGKIVDHRMLLQRRDGQVIDAGPIKVKPPGTIAYIAYEAQVDEPDIYVSKDGGLWHNAASEGRFAGGSSSLVHSGCWTGDRFLLGIYQYVDTYSTMLQSYDGGTWAFHLDLETFNFASSSGITGMDASGNGLVVVVGGPHFGADEDSNLCISRDFGETWEVLPFDEDLYPFSGYSLNGVCIKNDYEWIVTDNTIFWYTYDGGGHWTEIVFPSEFTPQYNFGTGMLFFNSCWWLYGYGSGEGIWDTPLIKSEDLVVWTPVVTPWSGTYPPFETFKGSSHADDSGEIVVLECDPISNTMIANGYSNTNGSFIMMSDDGGFHWFEIGYVSDSDFSSVHGWDGFYKWPIDWSFAPSGGMVFAYGRWFVVNTFGVPEPTYPPIFRISPNGQITEPVYPSTQVGMLGNIILAGGDLTF